jgi:hypothetical protein
MRRWYSELPVRWYAMILIYTCTFDRYSLNELPCSKLRGIKTPKDRSKRRGI